MDRVFKLKYVYWTIAGTVRKYRLLFSFWTNVFAGIMELHYVSTVANYQYLLLYKGILSLYNIISNQHLYKFVNSLVNVHPTLPFFALILSDCLLFFLSLDLPGR